MLIKKTLITAIATSSLLFTPLLSSAASADTYTTGNGAFSSSAVNATSQNDTTAVQDNKANVTNDVQANLNTGGNSANNLTGGNAAIRTGNTYANTGITNQVNSNQAMLAGGNAGGSGTAFVGGNGAFSQSAASNNANNTTSAFQNNQAWIDNSVSNNENTGKNSASNLTGGSAAILTGNAGASTNIFNAANQNSLQMNNAGGGFSGNGGDVFVTGNGAGSDNAATATNNNASTAVQGNNAWVNNNVGGFLNTGKNSSNNDTGAGASILTGGTWTGSNLDTMVNSNWASLQGMNGFGGGLNKVSYNGAFSNNAVNSTNGNSQSAFQTNKANVENSVFGSSNTGKNQVENSTGGLFYFVDPSVYSGNAVESTGVTTQANKNVLSSFDFGGQQVNLSFDPGALLSWMQ